MDENKTQPNNKDIKVLRTYTTDMADAIRTNEISVIKIALAEKEKREQEEIYKKAEGTNFSKAFLVIGGVILIAVAILGSYFLIQSKKEKVTSQPTMNNIDTFISYDSSSYMDVININNASDLLNMIAQEQQSKTSSVKALFLTKKINNVPEELTSKDFLSLIKTTAPGAFIRSLYDKYLLGKYLTKTDKSSTFLIFKTNDYNITYASMLEWEKTMLKDLYILFSIDISKSSNQIFEKQWKDTIINNRDARVLYGDNEEGILYYVFINKNTFVITNNIEAMKEVIDRLIIKDAKI